MKNLRLIIIGWMLLWLTGNGALAAAMPFCNHGAGHHGDHVADMLHHDHMAQQQEHGDHDHQHAGHQYSEATGDAKPSGLLSFLCNNCDLCHLATSVLPPDGLSDVLPLPDANYQAGPVATLVSRSPDTPLRVPLSPRA